MSIALSGSGLPAAAPEVQGSSGGGGGGGCTVRNNAPFDPLFPLLFIMAGGYLGRCNRRLNRVQ